MDLNFLCDVACVAASRWRHNPYVQKEKYELQSFAAYETEAISEVAKISFGLGPLHDRCLFFPRCTR